MGGDWMAVDMTWTSTPTRVRGIGSHRRNTCVVAFPDGPVNALPEPSLPQNAYKKFTSGQIGQFTGIFPMPRTDGSDATARHLLCLGVSMPAGPFRSFQPDPFMKKNSQSRILLHNRGTGDLTEDDVEK